MKGKETYDHRHVASKLGWKEQVVVDLDPRELQFVIGMIKVHEEAEKRTSSTGDFAPERK